jgi:hypothetical protein
MSRPCVCGGSNENCRYCSGRGDIPDSLANALNAHSHRPESQKVQPGAKTAKRRERKPDTFLKVSKVQAQVAKLQQISAMISGFRLQRPAASPKHQRVFCPKGCSARLDPQDVERHVLLAHLPAPVKPGMPKRVLCPKGCGTQLKPQDVDRHLRLAHVVAVAVQPQPRSLLNHLRPSEYPFCPVCKVRVKASKLNRHLKKVHKAASTRATTKATVIHSEKDVLRESTTLVAPRDKNLDATKLYAHSYRESGRFGSHPSHDGFDDESGPE